MAAIKLSERERNFITVTIGFAVFYVFYQFLLTPMWAEIAKLKDKAREQRLELKIAEGKIKIMDAIEKSVGVVPRKSAAPREDKALEVLRLLSQATAKSGLNLSFIKPLLEDKGEGLKFNLFCSGRYKDLYGFLSILYRLRILVVIDSLDIGTHGTSPDLDIKMILTAYY